MKSKIALLFLITLLVLSCSKEQEPNSQTAPTANFELPQIDDGINNDPTELYNDFLIAGQNIVSGNVTVTLVDGIVVVTYTTEGDWVIDETHLYVGDIGDLPTNNSGNPQIGHFPYSNTHNGETTVSYSTITLAPGECVYIAVHAVVTNTVTGESETAWGNGSPIGGNSWAMGFEVCN
ncbi:MAG: hypothetical protein KDC91_02665 [Flavobacteriaceae bacterium]|nr:hypothetical protein [Flavobacteriaceae bacterium]